MAFKRIKNLPVFAGQNAPANGCRKYQAAPEMAAFPPRLFSNIQLLDFAGQGITAIAQQ